MSGSERWHVDGIHGYLWPMRRSDVGGVDQSWSVIESARVVRPMGTQD
jgi:hypothetical protein